MTRDPQRAVVVTTLRPDQAARCLGLTGQAGWVVPFETGSALVVDDVRAAMGAASAASTLAGRRTNAVLWRDDLHLAEWPSGELADEAGSGSQRRPAAGLTVVRRGRLVAGHVWEGPRTGKGLPAPERPDADESDVAAAIAAALEVGPKAPLLRAALAGTGDPTRMLGVAAELLGLPASLLGLLDDECMPRAAIAVEVDPGSADSFRSFVRNQHSNLPRWWTVTSWLLPAVAAGVFVICILLAVLDRSAGRTDDIVGFSVLAFITGSVSAGWFWFSRRPPR